MKPPESIWISGFRWKKPLPAGLACAATHFSVYTMVERPHAAMHKLTVASRERLFPVRSLHL
jgi:hypothetical protein